MNIGTAKIHAIYICNSVYSMAKQKSGRALSSMFHHYDRIQMPIAANRKTCLRLMHASKSRV